MFYDFHLTAYSLKVYHIVQIICTPYIAGRIANTPLENTFSIKIAIAFFYFLLISCRQIVFVVCHVFPTYFLLGNFNIIIHCRANLFITPSKTRRQDGDHELFSYSFLCGLSSNVYICRQSTLY